MLQSRTSLAAALLAVAGLCGCGQKGPLTLPHAAAAASAASAAGGANR